MTIEQLKAHLAEYVLTLDGTDKDEYWGTPRSVEGGAIEDFIGWLEKRLGPNVGEGL